MNRRSSFRARLCAAALSALAGLAALPARAEPKVEAKRALQGEDVSLAVGETLTLSARGVRNYSVGVAGIVDVTLTSDATQFVLIGKAPGSTTLLLIRSDGTQSTVSVAVFARPPALVEKELADLLSGLNVQSRRVGPQIVLDGVVTSEADLRRVQQIASLYPAQVTSLVQLSEPGTLSGAAAVRSLIRIDFYFVQYDKNSSYQVGIGWPDAIGRTATATYAYDFLAGGAATATATVASQPLPRLDLAASHGWAKVIKQATVITNNDAEATYANGGEQNFPVNTGLTIGLERIQFGTDLTVLPHYDAHKSEISMRVVADVSDLSSAASGTTLPGRLTSKLTTHVSLKLGQSLVLSGIRTQSLTHSNTGLPGLSEIPLLGILFGSRSNMNLETEGAIFVVPSVVQSVPDAAAELVQSALDKFEAYSGNTEDLKAYDRRPGGSAGVPR
jgi:pilus assembly protein CpaC